MRTFTHLKPTFLLLFFFISGPLSRAQLCTDPGFSPLIASKNVKNLTDAEIVDLDMDGDRDIVVASGIDNKVIWLKNDGAQSFTEHDISNKMTGVSDISVVDFDHDGDPDIVAACAGSGDLYFIENLGEALAFVDRYLVTISGITSIDVSDIDRDGDWDIGYTSPSLKTVGYVLNNAPTYTDVPVSNSLAGANAVDALDLDKDGDIDLMAASPDDGLVVVFWNDGSLSFSAEDLASGIKGVASFQVADLNRDGFWDFVAPNPTDDELLLFKNDGGNNFGPEVIDNSAKGITWVSVADVNGDGTYDILGASPVAGVLFWYSHAGHLSFDRQVVSADLPDVPTAAVGDLDRDGDLDLVSGSPSDGGLIHFENTCEQCTGIAFNSVSINTGGTNNPIRGTLVDMDMDGDIDILSNYNPTQGIYLTVNQGNGTFAAPALIGGTANTNWLEAGDIDGDGDPDVIASSTALPGLSWFENDGSTPYTEHSISSTTSYLHIDVGDLDGDGDLDLMGGNGLGIQWWINDGSGNFTSQTISVLSMQYRVLTMVDLDQDGDMDILTGSTGSNRIDWMDNQGSQTFLLRSISPTRPSDHLIAEDIDMDGDLDVVSISRDDNRLDWYENNGSQAFTEHPIDTPNGPYEIGWGDLDQDGDPDLVTGSISSGPIRWYENDGGTFTSHLFGPGTLHAFIAPADMDQDGDPDLVSFAALSDEIYVHYNYCRTLCGEDNLMVTESPVTPGTYHGVQTLSSNAQVDGDIVVIFKAGTSITLAPGFQVTGGAEFHALIEDCPAPSSLTEAPPATAGRRSFPLDKTDLPAGKTISVLPNPSRGEATILYELADPGPVKLSLQDLQGRTVRTLLSGARQESGQHQWHLNVQDLEAGFYIVRLETERELRAIKIVIMD